MPIPPIAAAVAAIAIAAMMIRRVMCHCQTPLTRAAAADPESEEDEEGEVAAQAAEQDETDLAILWNSTATTDEAEELLDPAAEAEEADPLEWTTL